MSARTTAVRRALAQAGEKGLAHLAAQQDTGTWLAQCGRQVRGRDIRVDAGPAAGEHAEHLGAAFCGDCRDIALAVADAVADGVAVLLRVSSGEQGPLQLREVAVTEVLVPVERARRPTDRSLTELAESIRQYGVVQPVVLRRGPTGLELVAGARRLAAARLAGLERVPALVRDMPAGEALLAGLVENLHRDDLDPIEQARAFAQALETLELSKEALADRLGLSRAQVANTIRLLALPDELRQQVADGRLSAAHGRALLRVADPTEQAALAARVGAEALSSKETDAAVRRVAGARSARVEPQLVEVARLLAGVLDARVKVTSGDGCARVLIEVPDGDLARVLSQLGAAGVRAA